MYLVTIAIPVYNVEKFVERAVLSALSQTFESIEFLIIDDKGTDKSIDVIRNVISNHSRGKNVRIIDHIVNKGTGATKNTAIREATGKYLFFMDSDDYIEPYCIEILYKYMLEADYDFVAASYRKIDENNNFIPGIVYQRHAFECSRELLEYYYVYRNEFVFATWNKLYNLSFLRDNNIDCIPHHLCEDQIFSFQLLFSANKALLVPDVLYSYFLNQGSIINRISQNDVDLRSAQEYLEINTFKSNYLLADVSRFFLISNIITESIYFSVIIYMSKKLNASQKKCLISKLKSNSIALKHRANSMFLPEKLLFAVTINSPYCVRRMIYLLIYLLKF